MARFHKYGVRDAENHSWRGGLWFFFPFFFFLLAGRGRSLMGIGEEGCNVVRVFWVYFFFFIYIHSSFNGIASENMGG